MTRVYVLHESPDWFAPLGAALDAAGVPRGEIFLDRGAVDLSGPPPEGVFFNRLSGTAHTRRHRLAVEHARALLRWLEGHGRRVVNGTEALEIAMSKTALHCALRASGIRAPRTAVAVGIERVVEAARGFSGPFLVKPNRGGKGIGICAFDSVDELIPFVVSGDIDDSADGVYLVQDYIQPAEPFIIRAEFIGGEFMYALRSETGHGFNLCPADTCRVPVLDDPGPRFAIETDFRHPILETYREFMREHRIEIAAIEFITDAQGRAFTYDLNINTNYNVEAEAEVGRSGMATMAAFLGRELERLTNPLALARG